jgi:biotin carboxylase
MKNAIVLGGTHDHINLIQKLREEGYYVILVDYLNNPPAAKAADVHIQESTTDKEEVLRLAKAKNASLVISACIDSALSTVAYVSERLSLPCHLQYSTALSITNKALMKDVFNKTGIPTPKHYVVKDWNNNVSNDLELPLVVKPADANSSKGITKVVRREDLNKAVETAYNFTSSKAVIIEEFKEGKELSIDVLIRNGTANLIMVSENIKSAVNSRTFTIVKNIYPAGISKKDEYRIIEIASKIAKAYDIKNAPLLIQLVSNDVEISVIECSLRIGGGSKIHFIRRMKGFDLLDAFVDLVLGNTIEWETSDRLPFGQMCYLYAKPGVLKSFHGFNELEKAGIIDQYFLYKKTGDRVIDNCYSSDRPAGILVTGVSLNRLIEKTSRAFNVLKILDFEGNNLLINID